MEETFSHEENKRQLKRNGEEKRFFSEERAGAGLAEDFSAVLELDWPAAVCEPWPIFALVRHSHARKLPRRSELRNVRIVFSGFRFWNARARFDLVSRC